MTETSRHCGTRNKLTSHVMKVARTLLHRPRAVTTRPSTASGHSLVPIASDGSLSYRTDFLKAQTAPKGQRGAPPPFSAFM
ncbi:hypothetical protein HYQ46_003355 [Verticillium longisporum]|nr:hypothetical protein HYQ46_003355 [Verticillium longisporum]